MSDTLVLPPSLPLPQQIILLPQLSDLLFHAELCWEDVRQECCSAPACVAGLWQSRIMIGPELVTLVGRAFVSQHCKEWGFLSQLLQGVIPPCGPAGAPRQSRSAPGHAGLSQEQLSHQRSQPLLLPKGVQCVCQNLDFQAADIPK